VPSTITEISVVPDSNSTVKDLKKKLIKRMQLDEEKEELILTTIKSG